MAAGAGVLLAIAAVCGVVRRDRRLANAGQSRSTTDGERFRAGRELRRVYGDRLRVAFDERAVEVAIVGLGLAAAIVLGALIAS